MYSAIVGEGLETAVFDLQTSFWGLNRSEFNSIYKKEGIFKKKKKKKNCQNVFQAI